MNNLTTNELQAQIESLEVKLAYQEDTIDSLNQTVTEQSEKLSRLETALKQVLEKMKSANLHEEAINDGVELPPHY